MTIQKVLVIDDSKTELMALTDILQRQGMQVRTAENGEDAMKRLAEDKRRSNSNRSGTTSSAAWDGVAARKSAAKSLNVKSV